MSSVLTIRGGVPLTGRVSVRGAKNLVPKAMVAALLGNEPSVLRNVPEIKDVEVVTSLLQLHGVTVDKDPVTGDLTLDPKAAKTAPSTAMRSMISGSVAAPESSVMPSARVALSNTCSVAPTDGYGKEILAPCRPLGAEMWMPPGRFSTTAPNWRRTLRW